MASRRPAARTSAGRPRSRGGSTALGGALLSWLVYLGLASLLTPVWAAYVAGSVLGVAVGLSLPAVRLVVGSRR